MIGVGPIKLRNCSGKAFVSTHDVSFHNVSASQANLGRLRMQPVLVKYFLIDWLRENHEESPSIISFCP